MSKAAIEIDRKACDDQRDRNVERDSCPPLFEQYANLRRARRQ